MRGRYLVQNPLLHGLLRPMDWLLDHVVSRSAVQTDEVRRVLVGVGGHRGDAVMATAAIAEVRRILPNAAIGVISGSWSAPVLAGMAGVEWQHTVDHWALDRSDASRYRKVARYAFGTARVVRSLREVGYDLAIDLYPFYPNMAGLFWRAGIRRRVGFSSGGGSALYSEARDWVDDRQHMSAKQLELVRASLRATAGETDVQYQLPDVSTTRRASAEAKLAAAGAGGAFVVVHANSGAPLREWPRRRWRQLVERLDARGMRVVLTGAGDGELAAASEIAAGLPHCSNLVGRLDWPEFVHVIGLAQAVLCGNTVTGHVAAAMKTPAIVLFAGTEDVREWRPLAPDVVTVTNAVPCAPCFRSRGCATMDCVRGIDPETVLQQLESILRAG